MSEDRNNSDKDTFLILGKQLKGIMNSKNPFRSQIISIKKSHLISKISHQSELQQLDTSRSFCINNFKILSDNKNEEKTTADIIKSSMKSNTLNVSGSMVRQTLSKKSFSKQNSKSLVQSEYVTSKLLQQIMKNKSNRNTQTVDEKVLSGLDKILKKTRTPVLGFIDHKNFVIAGKDYLRVYHFSENLWY